MATMTSPLYNFGNTCYLNTAFQCLFNVPEFVDIFIGEDKKNQNKDNMFGLIRSILYDLQIHKTNSNECKSLWRLFVKNIGLKFRNQMYIYEQNDLSEFLMILMDKIHEDTKELNLSELEINNLMNYQNDGKPYFVFPRKGSPSSDKLKNLNNLVYSETIQYYVKSLSKINLSTNSLFISQIKCGSCSKLHNNYEFQNGIHLDISDPEMKNDKFSLYDCFDQLIKINILNNENEQELQEWKCDVCKEQFPSNKSFIFWNLPKVLIIFLKRFRAIDNSGNFVKNKRVVDIPQVLNMKKYVINPKQHTMYKLTSTGCHIGSLDKGHYYSMIKKNSVTVDNVEHKNVWFRADDDVIDPLNRHDFNDHSNLQDYLKNAYILIYTHK